MSILLLFTGFIIAFAILFYYEYKIRQIRRTEPKNKVRFYVARDEDGKLWLYLGKPKRDRRSFCTTESSIAIISSRYFSKCGLDANNYANLKWEDEPVEVFLDLED